MLSLSSNCCRVDALKASANQLKMQLASIKEESGHQNETKSAGSKIQTVDAEIKAGDASKAEVALSSAKSAVEQALYEKSGKQHEQGVSSNGRLDVHA